MHMEILTVLHTVNDLWSVVPDRYVRLSEVSVGFATLRACFTISKQRPHIANTLSSTCYATVYIPRSSALRACCLDLPVIRHYITFSLPSPSFYLHLLSTFNLLSII